MNKKSLLITAGPTQESIDAVRLITNRSTGLMGYEIAKEALKRHYAVTLISGPTSLKPPSGAKFIPVQTATEMKNAVKKEFKKTDCLIMAAAVSDFRVKYISKHKIKKGKVLILKLVENPDILKSLTPKGNQIVVGFCLETCNLLENARKKLIDKKMDLIIANKVNAKHSPFGEGCKHYILLRKHGEPQNFKNVTKNETARAILDTIKNIMI